MADVKREVRELGQRITGLKAGDQVTLVLKKPKPKVDAVSARRAAAIASEHVDLARSALTLLARARAMAATDAAGAQKLFEAAQQAIGQVQGALPLAQDWLDAAKKDADTAASEVKDGYGAAKDSADIAVKHLEHLGSGLENALRAVGAFVEEQLTRVAH